MKNARYVLLLASSLFLTGCPPSPVNIVNILSPSNGEQFEVGELIIFSGSATDSFDGTLTGDSLVWRSNRDGEIGTGTEFARDDLSEGNHTITLTATNSSNNTGFDKIFIIISNTPKPSLAWCGGFEDCEPDSYQACICLENRGASGKVRLSASTYYDYQCVILNMEAGESTNHCFYFENCPTSSGTSFSYGAAEPSDIAGSGCNLSPDAQIISPENYFVYSSSEAITFTAEVTDSEDGSLSGGALVWSSDIDGELGTGTSISTTLSPGNHIVTLTATDSHGKEDTATIKGLIAANDVQHGKIVWNAWQPSALSSYKFEYAASSGYFFVNHRRTIYCLDALTGYEDYWPSYTIKGAALAIPPLAISNDNLYLISDDYLVFLNVQTGSVVLESMLKDLIPGFTIPETKNVAVVNDDLFFDFLETHSTSEPDPYIYNLDANNGTVKGRYKLANKISGNFAVHNGYIYTTENCIDSQTGNIIWQLDEGLEDYPIAVTDNFLYNGSYCINTTDGKVVWEYPVRGNHSSVSGNYLYFIERETIGARLLCLNAQSGEIIWDFEEHSSFLSLAITGEYVYVNTYYTIYGLDAKTGELKWVYQLDKKIPFDAYLIAENGYIYIYTKEAYGLGYRLILHCIRGVEGDTGSWPMFKYNAARTSAR